MLATILCDLIVDLTPLLPFTRKYGTKGCYYQADYEVVVNFDNEFGVALVRDGKIYGRITCKYV